MIQNDLLKTILTPEVLDRIEISCLIKASGGEIKVPKKDIIEVFDNPNKYAKVEAIDDGDNFVFKFAEPKDAPSSKEITELMIKRMFGGI
jgi:hypothetical protein